MPFRHFLGTWAVFWGGVFLVGKAAQISLSPILNYMKSFQRKEKTEASGFFGSFLAAKK